MAGSCGLLGVWVCWTFFRLVPSLWSLCRESHSLGWVLFTSRVHGLVPSCWQSSHDIFVSGCPISRHLLHRAAPKSDTSPICVCPSPHFWTSLPVQLPPLSALSVGSVLAGSGGCDQLPLVRLAGSMASRGYHATALDSSVLPCSVSGCSHMSLLLSCHSQCVLLCLSWIRASIRPSISLQPKSCVL